MPHAAAGIDHTNAGVAPFWPLRRQENEGIGSRACKFTAFQPQGPPAWRRRATKLCSHLLRDTTGRGQQGQPGCLWALGEGPGGHSRLAGRAGRRNLEGRHAGGKNLGTSRIACFPHSRLIATSHLFLGVGPPTSPPPLAHHTQASPSFLSHRSKLPLTHTGPSPAPGVSAAPALPPLLSGAIGSPAFHPLSLLQGWQSRSLVTPLPWLWHFLTPCPFLLGPGLHRVRQA